MIRDAATVLLLRGERPFEIFMVRRGGSAPFMANAMVFPGGRLDDADCDDALLAHVDCDRPSAATRLGMEDEVRALGLLVAGLRETFEEAGLLLASADPDSEAMRTARARLNAGETTLAEIAAEHGLSLHTGALAYLARWVTPPVEKRRYDTRFLAALAPDDQVGEHDAIETSASAWITPAAAVAAYEAKEIALAPPTYRILLELRGRSAEEVMAPRPLPTAIHPQVVHRSEELALALPGDPDYDPPGDARNRFTLRDGRWWSEGSGY